MSKKRSSNKRGKIGKLKGFSIEFLPYSEIKDLDSNKRIKKILDIVLGNHILMLQGHLKPDEETRLIGDTMAMIGHVKNFKGIELAVISNDKTNEQNIINKLKSRAVTLLAGADVSAITIIGPATIVKEIKKNPKKIELLLNK